MKVAFATEDFARVDAHFGWARHIAIYEVSSDAHRLVEVVQFDGDLKEDGTEGKLAAKLEAIKDCAIVYVAAIGGSAAAKVVNLKVHPVKIPRPQAIEDLIVRMQEVLKGTPPPWMRKAMLKGKERSFEDFEETSLV
ncbi:MAG: nitrogen fixation protein NifX [Betaproteobacteria bacterium]|nr:nitrogen fixation protein NifX [Betaproteobacteria bacterium]